MTIDEAMEALVGRKEFALRRNDGLVTINYVVHMPGTFDGIRADFRGITFDETTGECVSRPLHKFFGVGQTPETMFHELKDRTAAIFEKLDGTMVHWLRHQGRVVAATRMGPGTTHAHAAQEFAESRGLIPTIAAEIDDGYTPIFEFLSPRFPIVVRHPAERLVYLCSRNRETGDYCFAAHYPDLVQAYRFPFARLMAELEDRRDFEGFVCWLDNGMTVKAKCSWYTERHRAFDAMTRPAYKLYGLVFDGVMDDLIAAAQPHHKSPLERVYREAQEAFLAERDWLASQCAPILVADPWADGDPRAKRKAFVERVRQQHPADLGGLMLLYDGKPADDWIQARLMERFKEAYPDPIMVGAEAN